MIQAGKAVYTFNPNTQDSEPGGPLRSSSAWSTYPLQAEPRLHSKIIVPTTNDAPFAKFKFKKKNQMPCRVIHSHFILYDRAASVAKEKGFL